MITTFWHKNGETVEKSFDSFSMIPMAEIPPDVYVWIHLENPTEDEELSVFDEWAGVHELVLEDIQRADAQTSDALHHPKVEEFKKHLFIIVRTTYMPVRHENEDTLDYIRRLHGAQVSIVMNHNVMITHCERQVRSISKVQAMLRRNGDEMQRGPDYINALIIENTIDDLYDVAFLIEERMDFLEDAILNFDKSITMTRLMEHRRRVHVMRSAMMHLRTVIARLASAESKFISPDEAVYYRDVSDHIVQALDRLDLIRETIDGLVDLYFSMSSARLNNIMQILTVISTVFLPLTFITSWYGMNFEVMPELDYPWAYPAIIGVIVALGVSMLLFVRRRGWLG